MTEQDQLGRPGAQDLAAEFAANGAAAAGDEHALAGQQLAHRPRFRADGVAAQEVLQADVAHLLEADGAVEQLVKTGDGARLDARLLADAHDLANLDAGRSGHGDDDVVHAVALDQGGDGGAVAQHGCTIDGEAVLAGVIVNKADHVKAQAGIALHLARHHGAGVARTDDEQLVRVLHKGAQASQLVRAVALLQEAQHEARAGQETHAEEPFQQPDGARGHIAQVEHGQQPEIDGEDEDGGGDAGQQDVGHLLDAGIAPQAVVEAEGVVDGQAHQRNDEEEGPVLFEVGPDADQRLIAHQEGQHDGEPHAGQIEQHEIAHAQAG